MRTRVLLSFAIVFSLALAALAQIGAPQRPPLRLPGSPPPGAGSGLPWPQGLGRSEAIAGRVAAIDVDQMMVKSPDYGEVLFWIDDKTVVRVEKFRLTLKDLRVGDPVAVKLKRIKGKGPYATDIQTISDVKERKLHPEEPPKKTAVEAPVATDSAIVPAGETAAPPPAKPAEEPFPSLPAGAKGIVGTVAAVSDDTLEVRDQQNQTQKVLLTGVTLIKIAGTETTLPSVKTGQRVAVSGDRLDTGEWVAREVLVAASSAAEPATPAAGAAAAPAKGAQAEATPPASPAVSPDGLARFSGQIVSIGNEEIRVKTAKGELTVLVTAITEVQRLNMRRDFAALRQGDQVDVVGDVLDGGVVSARAVTVTKN